MQATTASSDSHSVRNVLVKDLADSQQVTQDLVNELMDTNRAMDYKDFEILDVVTQEYKVDNQFQLEPAGIECNHLEGNFLNIIQRKRYYHSLNNCFDRAGVYFVGAGGIGMSAIARYFINRGLVVAGYDKTPSALTLQLEKEGMLIHYEEDVEQIPLACRDKEHCLVIYTEARTRAMTIALSTNS